MSEQKDVQRKSRGGWLTKRVRPTCRTTFGEICVCCFFTGIEMAKVGEEKEKKKKCTSWLGRKMQEEIKTEELPVT